MEFGLTIWLKCFTDAQYKVVSTMLKDIAFRILGILLLYFNLGVKEYIAAEEHKTVRHAAGWAGMVFTSFYITDVVVRTKHSKLRIFDELVIVFIYMCLWAMFFSMFERINLIL